ncbi:MFS transporter [Cupriavidus plantarum]|uniref:MFS transporter n=1 Tax=Cupriavidus plantarum TaxID=942865 RepID=UPI00339D5317
MSIPTRAVVTVVLANALEFFDYFAFAVFAAYIAATFFPHDQPALSSIATFGAFATGFLLRPIGAIVLGSYADRAGRKPALLLTATLITAGTLGMAAIPRYETAGIVAPILLVLCRMIQGFAVGGEMGAAGALLTEHCAPRRRGLYCGWLLAGQGLALAAAGVCGAVLDSQLSVQQMGEWGWRIPFVLGASMVPVQLWLRHSLHVPERAVSEGVRTPPPGSGGSPPLGSGGHLGGWNALVWGTLLIAGGTVPTYIATFTAPFELAGSRPTIGESFLVTIALGTVTVLASVLGGWLSDRWGFGRIVVTARLLTVVAVVPTYLAARDGQALSFAIGIVVVTTMSCLAAAPTVAMLLMAVDPKRRAATLALIYSVGVALFGSTAPAVVASWNMLASTRMAPAWYIAVAGLAAVGAVWRVSALQARGTGGGVKPVEA